ncbi:MAG: hypothetical protein KAK00_04185 [Nanoarchaeota archaeon]|nr:hypothetical protein [Nanoarchaeota archaeon]
MPRIHTRIKRKLGITSSRKGRFRNVEGKNSAKTFSTEDKAKEYALKTSKLAEGSFNITKAKKNKRFKIIKI